MRAFRGTNVIVHRIALLGVALTLALVPSAAALAKGKPCPRLCRKDVKSCKATCTGSRKDRHQCKRGCKVGFAEICKGFAEPSCLPPQGPCGPVPLTCELMKYGFPGFQPGVEALPSGFPPAPDGARVCGSIVIEASGGSAIFVFYSTAAGPDATIGYYGGAFGSRGFAFGENAVDGDRAACDRGFVASQGGTTVGGLYVFAQEGAFAVVSGSGSGSVAPPGTKR